MILCEPMGSTTLSRHHNPIRRFNFKDAGSTKEILSIITQYYPNQIVYPICQIDRHNRRHYARCTIRAERAPCASGSRCWASTSKTPCLLSGCHRFPAPTPILAQGPLHSEPRRTIIDSRDVPCQIRAPRRRFIASLMGTTARSVGPLRAPHAGRFC